MSYIAERDAAVEAVLRVADFIRNHAGQIQQEAVREKGIHDLVTFVDEEAQHRIVDFLSSAFPDYEILAEEGAAPDAPPEAHGYRWIIDPVDGTTNFTHGVPPYSVSIGLQHRDRIVVGVVLEIGRNELFSAIRGEGLYVNGRRHRVSTCKVLDHSLVTTGFPYRDSTYGHVQTYLNVLKTFMMACRGVRRPGSAAADLAYVACGRFDGFFEPGLSAWDVAAGSLLIEEAGGQVSDFMGNADTFLFGKQIVASNGFLHDQFIPMVAPLARAMAFV